MESAPLKPHVEALLRKYEQQLAAKQRLLQQHHNDYVEGGALLLGDVIKDLKQVLGIPLPAPATAPAAPIDPRPWFTVRYRYHDASRRRSGLSPWDYQFERLQALDANDARVQFRERNTNIFSQYKNVEILAVERS